MRLKFVVTGDQHSLSRLGPVSRGTVEDIKVRHGSRAGRYWYTLTMLETTELWQNEAMFKVLESEVERENGYIDSMTYVRE